MCISVQPVLLFVCMILYLGKAEWQLVQHSIDGKVPYSCSCLFGAMPRAEMRVYSDQLAVLTQKIARQFCPSYDVRSATGEVRYHAISLLTSHASIQSYIYSWSVTVALVEM